VARLTTLLPAALLAALVATQTVAGPDGLTVDARLVGVGAAGVAVMLKAPFGIVVLVGAAVTALIRFFGWG
jgi:branched-subunit amino acid transport protein